MYAKTYAKMDILISDELNQCMACDYTSYEYGEFTTKRDTRLPRIGILKKMHVYCPSCKSFLRYFKGERRW
jgi:hypothetical protein